MMITLDTFDNGKLIIDIIDSMYNSNIIYNIICKDFIGNIKMNINITEEELYDILTLAKGCIEDNYTWGDKYNQDYILLRDKYLLGVIYTDLYTAINEDEVYPEDDLDITSYRLTFRLYNEYNRDIDIRKDIPIYAFSISALEIEYLYDNIGS